MRALTEKFNGTVRDSWLASEHLKSVGNSNLTKSKFLKRKEKKNEVAPVDIAELQLMRRLKQINEILFNLSLSLFHFLLNITNCLIGIKGFIFHTLFVLG